MNKNLSQLARQLGGIWSQLGVSQRISVVIATVAMLAGLAGVAYWSSRPDFTLLYGKLDESEAAKVIAALDESKVPYEARAGGSIYVPADKVYQVRMQMAGKGIPRGEGVGFEIFDKASFGLSDFVQRANYARAVQGELARTISQLDQIESARVMIVMPENRLLSDSLRKPTASVFVRIKGSGQLSPSAVNSIRFLVANSVEGLQANNVSVVDNQGNVLSENQENDSVAGMSGNQLSARRNYEQYLTKKAEGMLEQVLGPGQAVVRVSVDLNWDSLSKTEVKYDPDGQVARSSTINDETTDSDSPNAAGAPGVASNVPSDNNNNGGANATNASAAAPPVNANHSHKKLTTSTYEINTITNVMLQAAGSVKRVAAAVFIAQRFEGTGADRKAAPRTDAEKEKLRNIVKSALGIEETGDPARKDELTLEEMPFNDQASAEMTQQLDQQGKRQMWMDLGQKLIYPVMAVGILFLFFRMLKNAKMEDLPAGAPGGNGGGGFVKPGAPGTVTVEVLNQLIRENPANMSQAVRSWMTRGKSNPNN